MDSVATSAVGRLTLDETPREATVPRDQDSWRRRSQREDWMRVLGFESNPTSPRPSFRKSRSAAGSYSLTAEGRKAFTSYINLLEQIVQQTRQN